jgi:trimeric autotransporter adhesin
LNARDPSLVGNIDGNVGITNLPFGQIDGFRSFLASHDVVGTSSLQLPQGASFCTCQYLQWGYRESHFNYTDPNFPNVVRNEAFHIDTFVVGDLTTPTELNNIQNIGSATFNGQVIANVANGGDQYLAAGAFQDVWDFGARTGSMTITSLDGHNYASAAGGITSTANNTFTGPFSATDNSGIAGTMTGSFFNSPSLIAAYQGGTIYGQNPASTYRFGGTFAANR